MDKHFHIRLSEWLMAAVLVTSGLVLLQPADTFATYPALYGGLARVAPETTWGLASLLLGAGRLVILYINGHWRRSPHLRALGAFTSGFMWFQLTLGLFDAPVSLALAIYPWFFLLEVYSVYRASSDARVSDHRARLARA